jgi:glycosyltransferase involved in cell wall biosynthesis
MPSSNKAKSSRYQLWKEEGLKNVLRQVIFDLRLDPLLRVYRIWKRRGWRGIRQGIWRRVCRPVLWQRYSEEAAALVPWLDFAPKDIITSKKIHESYPGTIDIRSVSWFIPDFYHPFYGGVYTILRFANYLKKYKGINQQFVLVGTLSEKRCTQMITEAFPDLAPVTVRRVSAYIDLDQVEPTDVGIATLWSTAYFLLQFNTTKRKFYFLQDYEPLFYPAGSTYAQVETTYRFGFYCIANTPSIKTIYEKQYGGIAESFIPCVDTQIFQPARSQSVDSSTPFQVFFYGRPRHPRNGFELGSAALRLLKYRLGDRVRIVSAGATWDPGDFNLQGVVENLGLLDYQKTAELYRNCHAGLVMMFTRHPSYLPFELMASGSVVVTNYNPATTWLLKDGENCLLSEASATCLAEKLEQGLLDEKIRQHIIANAIQEMQTRHNNWDNEIEKIYAYMISPQASKR